ncbi:MAG: hypothetical protein ACT4OK_07245 [Gemmobacter sp.]
MGHLAEIRHDIDPAPQVTVAVADRARIVLAVVLIALAPDGRIAGPGLARVVQVCRGAPVMGGLGPAAIEELAGLTLRAIAARGPDRVLADLRGLMPRALAETALTMAVRAAFAGGRVPPETAGILGGLATHLGLSAAWLGDLFEVVGALERTFD